MSEKMLKVNDVAAALRCSVKKAYAIVHQNDFPKITIGRVYYIPESAFDKWIQKYTGKEYKIY